MEILKTYNTGWEQMQDYFADITRRKISRQLAQDLWNDLIAHLLNGGNMWHWCYAIEKKKYSIVAANSLVAQVRKRGKNKTNPERYNASLVLYYKKKHGIVFETKEQFVQFLDEKQKAKEAKQKAAFDLRAKKKEAKLLAKENKTQAEVGKKIKATLEDGSILFFKNNQEAALHFGYHPNYVGEMIKSGKKTRLNILFENLKKKNS